MTDQPTNPQFGYGEAMWRAVAQRPFAAWLALWLASFWLWLIVQLAVGVPWGSIVPGPPARSDIQYGNFEGKITPSGKPLVFEPGLVASDPSRLARSRPPRWAVVVDHEGRAVLATTTGSEQYWGWPRTLVNAYTIVGWDVTSPTAGYERMPLASIIRAPSSGNWSSLGESLRLRTSPTRWLLWSLAALTLWPMIPVAAFWSAWFVRQRRRVRRGACLACGHLRGPIPFASACPECGAEASSTDHAAAKRPQWVALIGPVLKFLAAWAVASVLALSACWLASERRPTPDFEKSVRESLDLFLERPELHSNRDSIDVGHSIAKRKVGWPWPFLEIDELQWYLHRRDGTTGPVAVERDISFRDPLHDFFTFNEDPTKLTFFTISEWFLVDFLLFVQLLVGHLAATVLLLRWRKKTNS